MERNRFKHDRMGYIGGSDLASILNMSRWKTVLQLWMEKTGRVEPPDLSDVEAVELGIELEGFVAKKFERKTGMKVRRPSVSHYTHKDYPWAKAQVDRLIEGTDELLEVKTGSAYKVKEWEGDEIPQEYLLQLFWQLAVTGKKTGYICVLIGGQRFLWKKVEADPEFQQELLEKAARFWQMVQDDVMPAASYGDDDALVELYPTANEEIQLVQSMEEAIALRQELAGQITELKKQQDEVEIKLKEAIGDSLGVKTEKYCVTWRPTTTRRFDSKAFIEAHEDLAAGFMKETKGRRLYIKSNKTEGVE